MLGASSMSCRRPVAKWSPRASVTIPTRSSMWIDSFPRGICGCNCIHKCLAGKNRSHIDDLVGIVTLALGDHFATGLLHDIELAPSIHTHDELVVRLGDVVEEKRLVYSRVV